MDPNKLIRLTRGCEVTAIPSGTRSLLPAGTEVRIMQSLGGSYSVWSNYGEMFRVDAKDADALGVTPAAKEQAPQTSAQPQEFSEANVWQQLKTVYDPEIPVNIVDLGLIYACDINSLEDGSKKLDVKMTMTAPGCGMGNVLKADVESKLSHLPGVKEVQVEVVFDPPWTPVRMSEAARLQLGIDVDYGSSDSSTAAYK